MTNPGNASRGPGIRFPPPLLFLGGLGASWFLDRRLDFVIDGDGAGLAQTAMGVAILAAGLGLMLWGIATFLRARAAIYPDQPARHLVITGPYRFTRNPMYVGLTLAYVGGAISLNTAWPFVFLPIVLLLLHLLVIRREEAYLRLAFPDDYAAYRRRVRRWI